jgi:hypothetical protein
MKVCVVCHVRPAAVPDRNRPDRTIKRVCKACHAERLRDDLGVIFALHQKCQYPEVKP